MVILILKVKHYTNSSFKDWTKCPIANAANEHFKVNTSQEFLDTLIINGVEYSHEPYLVSDYMSDMLKVSKLTSPETIIRTLKLTPTV